MNTPILFQHSGGAVVSYGIGIHMTDENDDCCNLPIIAFEDEAPVTSASIFAWVDSMRVLGLVAAAFALSGVAGLVAGVIYAVMR